jgi:signal transduction histidine kinase
MIKNCFRKKSIQTKLLITIFVIIGVSSFLAVLFIANILPFSSTVFIHIEESLKIDLLRAFRLYNTLTVIFAFTLSAVFITFIINKTLKPVRALTEGTKKIAQGDFKIELPIDNNKNDELTKLTDSFNKMARELSLNNMLSNDFISNVSHEFKTPISSIQGFATVLIGTKLTVEQKEYAEIIAYEAGRLTRLTSNILSLSKLENQVIITDKEEFYIDEQIRHSYVLLQNELNEKKIEIDFDLSQVEYYGNPELIQQIWNNVLGNAIKFSQENSLITVSCHNKDGQAVVSIKDNGIGMNKETIKRAFDKFYQGDTSHSGKGNGLGLSLVSRIVELCRGKIDIKSEPGNGTEVIVYLPFG